MKIIDLFASAVLAFGFGSVASAAERLDRGVAAFPTKDGQIYVGWRLLADDPEAVAFNVYRSETAEGPRRKVNAKPIVDSTNFVDARPPAGGGGGYYSVRPLIKGLELPASAAVAVDTATEVGGYRQIKFRGQYSAQKAGLADLDGDGKLDYVIKQPAFNVDPYVVGGSNFWKPSPEPYKLEAYRHDGKFLWSHDMGPGIETGVWYSPVVVYDVDGDGKAEVYCKAGPLDPADIARHADGRVIGGPEFLVKLDGETGRELARLPWPSREGINHRLFRGEMHEYNYASRNVLGLAYLDGKRPHLIVSRGTYTLIKLRAYDPQLNLKWSLETKGEYDSYKGQGTHGMQIADIDDDGRDEVIIGAAAVDDDGLPLWTTGRGHPDACHVGDIDPAHPGLEVFYGHEWAMDRGGVCLVEARTGRTLWAYDGPTAHVHSSGLVADIDPTRPGMECYAGESNGTRYWLYDAKGTRIADRSFGTLSPRPVWWTADSTKAIVVNRRMVSFQPPPRETSLPNTGELIKPPPSGTARTLAPFPSEFVKAAFGQIAGDIIGIADCMGDWREELIVSVAGELRIYSTTIPATTRRVCLMQDRQYRTGVGMQTMGYLSPPMVGGKPLNDYGKK